jgi:phage terminase large subunit GpA-like protein
MGAIVEWISLREFARRREVRLSAVQKAIESGRISAARGEARRQPHRRRSSSTRRPPTGTRTPIPSRPRAAAPCSACRPVRCGEQAAPGEQLDLAAEKRDVPAPAAASDKDPHGYYAARAKREQHQAELAELELLEQLGKLVSVDEMRQVAARRYRTLRDKLLNIPDRIAAILAAEKDPARVHAALTTELKRVLHELSDDADAELPKGLPSAWLLDCEIFAEAIRPDPDLTITQWADAHRVLSPEASAEPGPWRTDRVPHAREIMDVLSPSDPTQEVTFVAGTQVAKTEIGNNFIGFIIDWAPGPAMMVYPTSNTGKRSSRTRLAQMIDGDAQAARQDQRELARQVEQRELKEFPGGVLAIAGSNSAAELKSMPVRYLFEDEVDEYPDDVDGQGPADKLAEKRTDTFSRKKIYRTSTPTEKGARRSGGTGCARTCAATSCRARTAQASRCCTGSSSATRRARSGSGRRRRRDRAWWPPAPKAPRRATPASSSTSGTSASTASAHRGAPQDRRCSSAGRWIAEHPEIKGHAGFHLPAYYSPLGWFSWRQVVQDRLEADKDPSGHLLKIWTNTVAAEPYVNAAEQVSDLSLKQRAEPYKLGTVPMGGLLLTASVDVQANRLEVKVKAWGRGEESWLVAYEVIFGDTETSRRGTRWTSSCRRSSRTRAARSCASSPPRSTPAIARRRCTTGAARGCTATSSRCAASRRPARPSSAGRPSRTSTTAARRSRAASKLWPIGTDTAKSKIYARLKIERRARAACTSRSACPTSTTSSSPPSAWCRATTAAS